MNAEPKKSEQSTGRLSFRQALRQAPRRFLRLCADHWSLKLLSLFLAVCLWAGLITQDPTLTRERVFSDVPVSVVGEDTLIRSGLVILSGLEDEDLLIRLSADVPQRAYSSAAASNYNPRIDLTRITETGEQSLRVLTTSSTTYGNVDSVSPDTIKVVVDHYVTNYRVPVSLNIIGEYPAGFYGVAPVLDPSSVAVSGPETVVDQIAQLYVDFDVSLLSPQAGLARTVLPMRFVDAEGNEINRDLLSVTSASVVLRTITVEQRLYPTKTLSVSNLALTRGNPASGYQVKSVTASPSTILAAGDEEALFALEALFIDNTVDVSGKTESFTADVTLRKPGSLVYVSDTSVKLFVEIAPVLTTRTFDNIPLALRNVGEGFTSTANTAAVTVAVTGPENTVKKLSASRLTAYADLSGLAQGEHTLPVALEINSGDSLSYAITPSTCNVMVTAR